MIILTPRAVVRIKIGVSTQTLRTQWGALFGGVITTAGLPLPVLPGGEGEPSWAASGLSRTRTGQGSLLNPGPPGAPLHWVGARPAQP